MSIGSDEDIVSAWLQPVGLDEMLAALRHAGFSGDAYRSGNADLSARLEDERLGALHFLRHGFAEDRVFAIRLDLGGLDRLRRLPVRNLVYLRNVVAALATAWTGSNIRSRVDAVTHRSVIDQLRAMGGTPMFILGDSAASLYRRSVLRDDRWICPLAMDPLPGGIEALLRAPQAVPKPAADEQAIPTLWKFGQHDMQTGYPAHRRCQGIGGGDIEAFVAFAAPVIERYAAFLAAHVPVQARPEHWIAGLLPPVWQVGPQAQAQAQAQGPFMEPDSLLDQTEMYRRFNMLLERTVVALGFNVMRNFDSLLTRSGVIDEQYLVARKDSDLPAYGATEGIMSTSLWAIIDSGSIAVASSSIQDQFRQLLDEIRMVQLGGPA